MPEKIALAADHGGLGLKNHIKGYLLGQGYEVVDFGTQTVESCDYADFAAPACHAVQTGECKVAMLFCSTGVGMSIAANKMQNIRACCCSDTFSAEMTRRHNNANVLCMGELVVGTGLATRIVKAYLNARFEGGRHQRRIEKVEALHNQ